MAVSTSKCTWILTILGRAVLVPRRAKEFYTFLGLFFLSLSVSVLSLFMADCGRSMVEKRVNDICHTAWATKTNKKKKPKWGMIFKKKSHRQERCTFLGFEISMGSLSNRIRPVGRQSSDRLRDVGPPSMIDARRKVQLFSTSDQLWGRFHQLGQEKTET